MFVYQRVDVEKARLKKKEVLDRHGSSVLAWPPSQPVTGNPLASCRFRTGRRADGNLLVADLQMVVEGIIQECRRFHDITKCPETNIDIPRTW